MAFAACPRRDGLKYLLNGGEVVAQRVKKNILMAHPRPEKKGNLREAI